MMPHKDADPVIDIMKVPPENKKQSWFIISNIFNMDGRAASQTITDKIPHLLKLDVDPIVVSSITGEKDRNIRHYQVPPLTPVGLRFDLRYFLRRRMRNKLLRGMLSGLLSVVILPFYIFEKAFIRQESQWSWFLSAFLAGIYIVKTKQPALIYSTGGPGSAHFAAYLLARRYGLPWLAEIHDPMVAYGRSPETQRERFAYWLEEKICRYADVVWWFTEEALSRAKARHPMLGVRGHCLIPGAEPIPPSPSPYVKGRELIISHFGSLSKTRNLLIFLAALKKVVDRAPDLRNIIRLHLYGSKLDKISAGALQDFPYRETVTEYGRIEQEPETAESGRDRVLKLMRQSDCLLLLHGNDPYCEEYIPSKLYEYFFANRPILALIWSNNQMERMIRDMGHLTVRSDDVDQIAAVLDELCSRWLRDDLSPSGKQSPYSVEAAVRTLYKWAGEAVDHHGIKSR